MKVKNSKTKESLLGSWDAIHSVDKDPSTNSITISLDGQCWVKFELARVYFIHKVIIYNSFYTNWYETKLWCALSEDNFKTCIDTYNNVDVSVYNGDLKQKSCGTLKLSYGLTEEEQVYELTCNTEGDTVKLSKTAGEISLREIVITSSGTALIEIRWPLWL